MPERKRCGRCGVTPPFSVNDSVSLTAHYELDHPDVPFLTVAREIVTACS